MKSHLESITLEFCHTGRGKYLPPCRPRGGFLLPPHCCRSIIYDAATPSFPPPLFSVLFAGVIPAAIIVGSSAGWKFSRLSRENRWLLRRENRRPGESVGRRGQPFVVGSSRGLVDCGDCSPPSIRLGLGRRAAFVATWVSVDDRYSSPSGLRNCRFDRRAGENRCLTIR